MGFIERLRKNFEDQRATDTAKKAVQDALRAKQEQERQVRELELQRVSEERKKQALSFHQQSGIGDTMRELGKLVAAELQRGDGTIEIGAVTDGDGTSWIKRIGAAGSNDGFSDVSRHIKDGDSVVDYVFWERRKEWHINSKVQYDEFHEKIIVVETCPNGTTKFHAGRGGSSEVPSVGWKNDANILDLRLEIAYNHPLSHSYRKNVTPMSSGGRLGDPGVSGPCNG